MAGSIGHHGYVRAGVSGAKRGLGRRRLFKWLAKRRAAAVFVVLAALAIASSHVKEALSWLDGAPKLARVERVAAALGIARAPTVPITIVDIDEKTWEDWGRPAVTPRDKLARIVDAISRKDDKTDQAKADKPQAVLIDVDLSRADEADDRLKTALAALDRPVLLPREFKGDGIAKREPRKTNFDTLGRVSWVSVRFQTNEEGVVENWRLWEPVCPPMGPDAPGQPPQSRVPASPLPSPQLALSWLDDRGGDGAFSRQTLEKAAEAVCAGARTSNDEPEPDSALMPFAFGDVGGLVPNLPKITLKDGREVSPLIRVPALSLLGPSKQPDGRAVSPSLFKGRVVLIGASHSDSGDIHLTRYGAMPGVMILANAIALGDSAINASQAPDLMVKACAMVIAGLAFLAYRGLLFYAFAIVTYGLLLASYAALSVIFHPAVASQVVETAIAAIAAVLLIETLFDGIAAARKGKSLRLLFKRNGR